MKETVKINLNQQLFDLDSDAYDKLKKYLDDLRTIFLQSPDEADEILQDIEQRIAEILQEKLSSTKEVVTLADVEEVIQQLGTAEDFARETETTEEAGFTDEGAPQEDAQTYGESGRRRFYRDIDDNILGGVCSGLGHYFNIDPVWIRVFLLLLFLLKGFGLLIYLILWAVVPAARTTAQKLQMRGRPVNVENIQDYVKSEFSRVKSNWKQYSNSDSYRRTQNAATEFFRVLGRIFVVLAKIILVLIGIGFAFGLLALVIGLTTGFNYNGPFNHWHWEGPHFEFWPHVFPVLQHNTLFSVAVLLVILIPIIAILVSILKFILNVHTRNRILSAFTWTFWTLALVFVIFTLVTSNISDSFAYYTSSEKQLDIDRDEVLYIEVEEDWRLKHDMAHYHFMGKEIIRDKYDETCFIRPVLHIEYTTDEQPYLVIEEHAAIPDFEDDYYGELEFEWTFYDSLLVLDEYFTIEDEELWQWPSLHLVLYLPEGQQVQLSRDVQDLLSGAEENWYFDYSYFERRLSMRGSQLQPLED